MMPKRTSAQMHADRFRRFLCLYLCLALLPLLIPGSIRTANAAAAPDVRVHLKRLALTDRADLWLDGTYTAGPDSEATMAFPAAVR